MGESLGQFGVATPSSHDAHVRYPDFFIVGAARAGTTALWHYLRQHPDVFMPKAKEPHFLCDRRPAWAPATFDAYLQLFADAGSRRVVGEASTGYLTAKESPGYISARFPRAKIVIMLRNPVDRAHSLYRLNCSLGVEPLGSFERALAREAGRSQSERFKERSRYPWQSFLYFQSGLTAAGVDSFQKTFPPAQVHIVLYDDFKSRTLDVTREVYRFLGVDPSFTPKIRVVHASQFPLSTRLQCLIKRLATHRERARNGGPQTWLDRMLHGASFLNLKLGSRLRSDTVKRSTRRILSRRYRDDVLETGRLIGRDLSGWIDNLDLNQSPARHEVATADDSVARHPTT